MWLGRMLAVAATIALALGLAAPAMARPHAAVEWKRIEVPPGPDADRLTRELKAALTLATRRADFGKRAATATIRLVEFRAEERGDVLKLSCVLVGRLEGGKGARSRISYGGGRKITIT